MLSEILKLPNTVLNELSKLNLLYSLEHGDVSTLNKHILNINLILCEESSVRSLMYKYKSKRSVDKLFADLRYTEDLLLSLKNNLMKEGFAYEKDII